MTLSQIQAEFIDTLLKPDMFRSESVEITVEIITAQEEATALNNTLDNLFQLFAYLDNFTNETIEYLDDESMAQVSISINVQCMPTSYVLKMLGSMIIYIWNTDILI